MFIILREIRLKKGKVYHTMEMKKEHKFDV